MPRRRKYVKRKRPTKKYPTRKYGARARFGRFARARARGIIPRHTVLQASQKTRLSRLVRFEDQRSFSVDDNGVNAAGHAVPIDMVLTLNDPVNMWMQNSAGVYTRSGYWQSNDFGEKDHRMPGLADFISNMNGTRALMKNPFSETGNLIMGDGRYRYAECLSTSVTISVINTGMAAGSTVTQPFSKLLVRKATQFEDLTRGQTLSASYNADQQARIPLVKAALLKSNANGQITKGATITTKYTFRNMNRGSGKMVTNNFNMDKAPAEKDFLHMQILPLENSYSATDRCGKFRIVVKVSCIVKCSEPNTVTNGYEGSGINMESVAGGD